MQMQLKNDDITELRRRLAEDAQQAEESAHGLEWVNPQFWKQYMGKDGKRLYSSFSDDELLELLRQAAARMKHPPTQRDIFCVYRSYIRRRFTNWPTALRAAGLKPPKEKRPPR